jgi:sensor histidine kinase regulating citrate/malate metabolism
MGLHISLAILNALGGHISVKSVRDVGSIFRFVIPCQARDLPYHPEYTAPNHYMNNVGYEPNQMQNQPMGNQFNNFGNLQHNKVPHHKANISGSMSLIISDIPIREDKNTVGNLNASQLNTKRNTTIDDLFAQLQPIRVVTNPNTNRGETKNWNSIEEIKDDNSTS